LRGLAAIGMHRDELSLQREQMRMQREQMGIQREQMEMQRREMEAQREWEERRYRFNAQQTREFYKEMVGYQRGLLKTLMEYRGQEQAAKKELVGDILEGLVKTTDMTLERLSGMLGRDAREEIVKRLAGPPSGVEEEASGASRELREIGEELRREEEERKRKEKMTETELETLSRAEEESLQRLARLTGRQPEEIRGLVAGPDAFQKVEKGYGPTVAARTTENLLLTPIGLGALGTRAASRRLRGTLAGRWYENMYRFYGKLAGGVRRVMGVGEREKRVRDIKAALSQYKALQRKREQARMKLVGGTMGVPPSLLTGTK